MLISEHAIEHRAGRLTGGILVQGQDVLPPQNIPNTNKDESRTALIYGGAGEL